MCKRAYAGVFAGYPAGANASLTDSRKANQLKATEGQTMGRKEAIFLERIGMTGQDSPDALFLGEVEPASVDGIFRPIIDEYCKFVKHHYDGALSKSLEYEIDKYKCDTYQDYINILKERYTMTERREFDRDEWNEYRFNKGIQKGVNYTPDEQGYFNYICQHFPHLPVVKFFTQNQPVYLQEKERQKHTLITGGSGSGKSELIKHLVNSYLQKDFNNCLVIIDPHGELAEEIIKLKSIDKRHCLYFDPSLSNQIYPCLNPFEIEDRSEENIEKTTQYLVEVFQETLSNSQLSLQMETILKPCISTLLRMGGRSLYDLMVFMDDKRNKELVNYAIQTSNRIIKEHFQHSFYDTQYNVTKKSIYTKLLSLLNSNIFYNITCNPSTISLEKELNRKNILIFNLSKGKIGVETSQTFGRFLLSLIQAHAMKRARQEKGERIPTHLFIDEFPNFVTKSVEVIFTEARKYKTFLTVVMQYLGQNQDSKYTKMIMSNTNIKMTGINEYSTLSDIARNTGADVKALQNLKPGQFGVKVGSGQSHIVKIPTTTLGDRQAVPKDQLIKRIKASMFEYCEEPEAIQEQEHGAEDLDNQAQGKRTPRVHRKTLKPTSDF